MGESVYVSVVYCVWACLWTDGTFTNNIFRMAWQLGNPCQTEFMCTMDGVWAVTMLCHARLVHNALSCFGHVYFCTELSHCKPCLAMYFCSLAKAGERSQSPIMHKRCISGWLLINMSVQQIGACRSRTKTFVDSRQAH